MRCRYQVTCYFALRAWRYYQWTRDLPTARALYPAVRRAAFYLAARSTRDGVPAAERLSYWADWKDVAYVRGRE